MVDDSDEEGEDFEIASNTGVQSDNDTDEVNSHSEEIFLEVNTSSLFLCRVLAVLF